MENPYQRPVATTLAKKQHPPRLAGRLLAVPLAAGALLIPFTGLFVSGSEPSLPDPVVRDVAAAGFLFSFAPAWGSRLTDSGLEGVGAGGC